MRTLRDEVRSRRHHRARVLPGHRAAAGRRTGAVGRRGAAEPGDRARQALVRAKATVHRHRRQRPAALPGLPDHQPLRRDRRRPGAGLPRGRPAGVHRHHAVPPHRRGLSRSRSWACWSPRRCAAWAPSWSTQTASSSSSRWRRATSSRRPSSASARSAGRASTTPTGQAGVWLDSPDDRHAARAGHGRRASCRPWCASTGASAST